MIKENKKTPTYLIFCLVLENDVKSIYINHKKKAFDPYRSELY